MTGLRIEVRPTIGRLLRISRSNLIFPHGYLPGSVDEVTIFINLLESDILLGIVDCIINGNDRFAVSEKGNAHSLSTYLHHQPIPTYRLRVPAEPVARLILLLLNTARRT